MNAVLKHKRGGVASGLKRGGQGDCRREEARSDMSQEIQSWLSEKIKLLDDSKLEALAWENVGLHQRASEAG